MALSPHTRVRRAEYPDGTVGGAAPGGRGPAAPLPRGEFPPPSKPNTRSLISEPISDPISDPISAQISAAASAPSPVHASTGRKSPPLLPAPPRSSIPISDRISARRPPLSPPPPAHPPVTTPPRRPSAPARADTAGAARGGAGEHGRAGGRV